MVSMFRSEEMKLCQLFLQSDAAYSCVSELGELGVVEFRDLNPDVNAFQRKYVGEVRRCDEMERKLRFMLKEIEKAEIEVADTSENHEAPPPREMIDLEAQFEQLENEMKESNANFEQLQKTSLELNELKHILRKTQSFFEEEGYAEAQAHVGEIEPTTAGGQLGFVAGVIPRDRVAGFERLLWRACRGNVFFKQAEIDAKLYDPSSGDHVNKCVFIVFFQGEQLKQRVKKICEGFKASLYPCPETPAERREMAVGVMTRIEDVQTVLNQTQDHRHRLLQNIASNINGWLIKVKKIKAIYHTMNMFNIDVTEKCLIAECWAPVIDLDRIQKALQTGTQKNGSSVPPIINQMKTKQTPPTYNRTNKFTHGFQAIIDAYGVSDYQEVNPALYTLITFPFLFSVMFGDFGHGIVMAAFAAWMIYAEKKLANWKAGGEMFDTIFGGRYVILLMGIFSIYSGLLYNDMFSKSLNIFGSGWVELPQSNRDYIYTDVKRRVEDKTVDTLMFNPNDTARETPYYFGVDPIWQTATNKLTFTNSLKMKLSIIFGVTHMTFGVILGLFNHLHFKDYLKIWTEFIPQLLFISCIFGYLVICIFYKWVVFSIRDQYQPSLLLGLIGMFLHFGSKIEKADLLYTGQGTVQPLLVAIAVLAVPWMLLIRPFVLKSRAAKKQSSGGHRRMREDDKEAIINATDDSPSPTSDVHEDDEEEEFDFGEIFINQAIHTIEYCLGCISNTASYLRLWALSLAHAQLSEVLWTMVFKIGLGMGGTLIGSIAIFVIFSAWACTTVVILLVMEGLSAFLHTLRLHWVEFNSKFYHGSGNKFVPFAFKTILEEEQQ